MKLTKITSILFRWVLLVFLLDASQFAAAAYCTTASPGAQQWQNQPITSQKNQFTATWQVTPLQNGSDALIALSSGAQTDWRGLAAILRFNSDNFIDARNGDHYSADSQMPYSANVQYAVRMVVNTVSHTYSVYVRPDGMPEQAIAENYAFRTEQSQITALNNRVVEAEVGALSVCNFNLDYTARVDRTAAPGADQWKNASFAPESGQFVAEFFAVPKADGMDGLVALSQGSQTNWSKLAAIVRFNSSGTIDVRDGDIYRADQAVNYRAGSIYYIRMEVDTIAHTYSVYAGPQDATELVAHDYAFRTEQSAVASLDNSVIEAESGALDVYKWRISPASGCINSGGLDDWSNLPMGPYGSSSIIEFDVTPTQNGSDALVGLSQGAQNTSAGLEAILRFAPDNSVQVRDGARYIPIASYQAGQSYHVRMSLVFWGTDGYYWTEMTGVSDSALANYNSDQPYTTPLDNWAMHAQQGGLQVCHFTSRPTYQEF